MTGNKMRISLSQRGDEIVGKSECQGDGLFMLECLSVVISDLADRIGTTPADVLRDLYSLTTASITTTIAAKSTESTK